MLTHKGIEANPDKCDAIIQMKSPQNVIEVQSLKQPSRVQDPPRGTQFGPRGWCTTRVLSYRLPTNGQAHQRDIPSKGPPPPKVLPLSPNRIPKVRLIRGPTCPRINNSHVDTLAQLTTSKTLPRHIALYRVLSSLVMDKHEILQVEAKDRG
ncbi:hypothetical protein CR513_05834, partial [Mucuna pruriens]